MDIHWLFLVLLAILIIYRDNHLDRSKRIGTRAFFQMIEALNITTLIIEDRGLFCNRVSFLHEGWKFSALISKRTELPIKCDVIG